jgi:hypothetical protein
MRLAVQRLLVGPTLSLGSSPHHTPRHPRRVPAELAPPRAPLAGPRKSRSTMASRSGCHCTPSATSSSFVFPPPRIFLTSTRNMRGCIGLAREKCIDSYAKFPILPGNWHMLWAFEIPVREKEKPSGQRRPVIRAHHRPSGAVKKARRPTPVFPRRHYFRQRAWRPGLPPSQRHQHLCLLPRAGRRPHHRLSAPSSRPARSTRHMCLREP